MRVLIRSILAAAVLLSVTAWECHAATTTRKLGDGKSSSNTAKRSNSSASSSGYHYLIMITDFDKEKKSYQVLSREAKIALDKEINLERRLFSRTESAVEKAWKSDSLTAEQRYPHLSARKLTVRGNYRTAAQAQEKMAELIARNDARKKEVAKGRALSEKVKGKKKSPKKPSAPRVIKRMGSLSPLGVGGNAKPVVVQWEPQKAIGVASERLAAEMAERISASTSE